MRAFVKIQRRQTVLAVDDQELFFRLLQMADGPISIQGLEPQPLRSKQQDSSRNWRLADRSFIEIPNRPHFRAGEAALKSLFAVFDSGYELRHVIFRWQLLGLDLLALIVKATDETHLRQKLFGRVRCEIEHR